MARKTALILALLASAAIGSATVTAQRADPIKPGDVPARKKSTIVLPKGSYVPPKTPWGDPDIAGDYNNSDESGIPFERPDEFAGRKLDDVKPDELAKIVKERQAQTIERTPGLSEFPGATSPMHWFESYNAENSRAWMVSSPEDGKVPAQVPAVAARNAARQAARKGRGPADAPIDRSLYDRCITRGVPGSMMPAIYGNSYRIHQGPGFVTITYEMVHDTRVIPLDGRPHLPQSFRNYVGDARGHWEGNVLVVETTNFTDKTPYRGSSENLKLIERFTPLGPDTVEWSVTFDDPQTWTKPWTFGMNLTRDETQPPFEYACHEGNYGLKNILEAARAEERAGTAPAPR
jgi:hypothetical protein